MKPGSRAVGFAESYRGVEGATSTLAGAVVRGDRSVDDFVLGRCTVGGYDATEALAELWSRLDRQDARYVFLAGVAPAWYNLIDVEAVAEVTDRPVIAVSFEESDGLEAAIREAFEGTVREERLAAYRELPERRRFTVDGGPLFVRCVGIDPEDAEEVVDAYTHERRPEPLRVAKRLARRADAARRRWRGDDRGR